MFDGLLPALGPEIWQKFKVAETQNNLNIKVKVTFLNVWRINFLKLRLEIDQIRLKVPYIVFRELSNGEIHHQGDFWEGFPAKLWQRTITPTLSIVNFKKRRKSLVKIGWYMNDIKLYRGIYKKKNRDDMSTE